MANNNLGRKAMLGGELLLTLVFFLGIGWTLFWGLVAQGWPTVVAGSAVLVVNVVIGLGFVLINHIFARSWKTAVFAVAFFGCAGAFVYFVERPFVQTYVLGERAQWEEAHQKADSLQPRLTAASTKVQAVADVLPQLTALQSRICGAAEADRSGALTGAAGMGPMVRSLTATCEGIKTGVAASTATIQGLQTAHSGLTQRYAALQGTIASRRGTLTSVYLELAAINTAAEGLGRLNTAQLTSLFGTVRGQLASAPVPAGAVGEVYRGILGNLSQSVQGAEDAVKAALTTLNAPLPAVPDLAQPTLDVALSNQLHKFGSDDMRITAVLLGGPLFLFLVFGVGGLFLRSYTEELEAKRAKLAHKLALANLPGQVAATQAETPPTEPPAEPTPPAPVKGPGLVSKLKQRVHKVWAGFKAARAERKAAKAPVAQSAPRVEPSLNSAPAQPAADVVAPAPANDAAARVITLADVEAAYYAAQRANVADAIYQQLVAVAKVVQADGQLAYATLTAKWPELARYFNPAPAPAQAAE